MPTVNIEIVTGRGAVQAKRNGNIVVTIYPSDGIVPVIYNIGDTFEFDAYPETCVTSGSCIDKTKPYSFQKYCGDIVCSFSTTVNPLSGTIATDGYLGVYFVGIPATVNVVVQNTVGGQVDVYVNTRFSTTVTSSQTVNCFINDIVRFNAKPSSGYSFQKYCGDAGCTITTITNPLDVSISTTNGYVYTYFTESISCSSFIPSCCVKTNGYIDINSILLSAVGACNSFTPSCNSVPLNTQYMGAFSVSHLTPKQVYTVTCTVKKDGNIIINKSISATASANGDLLCVLLDSGIWSLLDNWNKIDVGKPLIFDSLSTYIINWTYA